MPPFLIGFPRQEAMSTPIVHESPVALGCVRLLVSAGAKVVQGRDKAATSQPGLLEKTCTLLPPAVCAALHGRGQQLPARHLRGARPLRFTQLDLGGCFQVSGLPTSPGRQYYVPGGRSRHARRAAERVDRGLGHRLVFGCVLAWLPFGLLPRTWRFPISTGIWLFGSEL